MASEISLIISQSPPFSQLEFVTHWAIIFPVKRLSKPLWMALAVGILLLAGWIGNRTGSTPPTPRLPAATALPLEQQAAQRMAAGDTAGAAARWQALAAREPSNAAAHYHLGLLLAALDPPAAVDHLLLAAELSPTYAAAEGLAKDIRSAALLEDGAYTLLQSGRSLASLGEWTLAETAFRRAAEERPDYAEAWAFWGEAGQHLTPPAAAEQSLARLERAVQLDAGLLSAHTLLALYWQRQDQPQRALEALTAALDDHAASPALQAELGNALAALGRLEEAAAAYQKAIELAPQESVFAIQGALFAVRYEYDLRSTGLPWARRAVTLAPHDPQALDALGQVLLLLEDVNSAGRFFRRALQADGAYLPARLHLGLVYILQGEREAARGEWLAVRSAAPASPEGEQAARLLETYFP